MTPAPDERPGFFTYQAYSKTAIGPDVNGGSVGRAIRQASRASPLPVLLLSPVRALTERWIVLPRGGDRETLSIPGQICEIARGSISGDLVRCGIDAVPRECLRALIPDNVIRWGERLSHGESMAIATAKIERGPQE
jgi:hypothetical protein